MERLQAALEKARAQRDQSETAQPRQRTAAQAAQSGNRGAWEALDDIRIDRNQMQRNRVTTVI